jgi:hypothetical protein
VWLDVEISSSEVIKTVVCSGVLQVWGGAARTSGMPGGVHVGVDDQWHFWGSLLLCSVAHCLGEGTCSQVDYPGMFSCVRGLVVF